MPTPRSWGPPRKVVIALGVLGALVSLGAIGAMIGRAPVLPPGSSAPSPVITVVKVVDGDTIKLSDGRTVRIIGIDTPETVAPGEPVECGGPEASAFARQTLLDRPVTLVEDPTQDRVDRYGRTLSSVVLPDGRDFSVLAAEAGHARAYRGKVPAQRYGEILAAESRARAVGLGLWGPACASPPPQPAPPPAPGPAPEPDAGPSGYYRTCSQARAAGAAPLHAGEAGYRPALDGDGDGVACEGQRQPEPLRRPAPDR